MSLLKSVYALVAVCASLLVCRAGDNNLPDNPVTNAPAYFQISLRSEGTVGLEQQRRAYVTVGTNIFILALPLDFRMDASDPNKVVFVKSDFSCFLTFRIIPTTSEARELRSAFCREQLLRQHPGALITDEFSQSAANHSGPAFDLQWRNTSGVEQSVRATFIPSPVGILEFTLLSKSENFARGKYFFNCLLMSLRTNEGGKLEIIPTSAPEQS